MFQSLITKVSTFFIAISASTLALVGFQQPEPSPPPEIKGVEIVSETPTPTPEVIVTATPSATPTATVSAKPLVQKIDCIGPDNKVFKATQEECDSFNAAWGVKTAVDEERTDTCDVDKIKQEGQTEMDKKKQPIIDIDNQIKALHSQFGQCDKSVDPSCAKHDQALTEQVRSLQQKQSELWSNKETSPDIEIAKMAERVIQCQSQNK